MRKEKIFLAFSDIFRTVFTHLSTMNTKQRVTRDRFPIIVKRGSCAVKIYRDRKPTGTYYRVCYHIGGKRERLNFVDLEKAKLEAESQASKLSRGDVDAMQLTGKDRLVYGRAVEAVRETGVPLDAAAREYTEARKHVDGVSLIDAAKFYARHHGRGIKRKSVAEAVDEMIAAKKTKGVSDVYLADLRYRLGVFKAAFHCDVSALVPDDVAAFFEGLRLSPRSYNNFVRVLRTFFAFAQNHGWLSKEADLLARVEKRTERPTPVEIFTPGELTALLKNASREVATCLALTAFAGLRAEEILRLDWSDIERRPGFIEVAAHKAKTATRRIVPISDNLARWVAIAPRNGARVWPHSKAWFFEAMRNAAADARIQWKQNALRHSFISYRLAEIQDVNRVALEAGNSPQMIFRHHRELATPQQARSWFATASVEAPNVVPIRLGVGKR
jgi:integrase